MLFRDWCFEYVNKFKRVAVKPSTYDSYLRYCNHIKTNVELSQVQLQDLQEIVNDMYNDHCARSTINHTLTVARQALNKAYALHLIDYTIPYSLLEIPHSVKHVISSLQEDEIRRLLGGSGFYHDLFCFLVRTGLRIGEALALRMCDIDLKNNVLYVRNTDYNGTLQPNKSSRARLIPLTSAIHDILISHLSIDPERRVFLNKFGRPLKYSTVRDAWTRFCRQHDISDCGLHALRHTFATMSIRSGANIKAVSQLLGHSDINITLNIYTDISPHQKLIAMQLLEKHISDNDKKEKKGGLS